MNDQTPTKKIESILYKVAVVDVSTSFAGRNGRRVHTYLILVNGLERIRVYVNEDKFTRSSHAKSDWSVGELIEGPDLRGQKYVSLAPSQMKRTNRAVIYTSRELRPTAY